MKSLVLKDLYNIAHNMKSLLFILVVLAFVFIPSADVLGYIFASAIICSMMVVTTFHFDEACGWNAYAMVMPLSRRDLVVSKYIALLLFTGFGALTGLVMGVLGSTITGKILFTPEWIVEILTSTLLALVLGMTVGGLNIPLLIRFGPEQGRLLLLVATMVPAGILAAANALLSLLGIPLTEAAVTVLIFLSPLLAGAWDYVLFRISCGLFEKQEL